MKHCIDCDKLKSSYGIRCGSCAKKELWRDPTYRKHMSETHKGFIPTNLQDLISFSKSEEGKKMRSEQNMGREPWNKGMKTTSISIKKADEHRMRIIFRHRLQKIIFERDGYECQICGSKSDLQVDHIQSWSEYKDLRFDPDNCRTLCARCHYKITFKKDMPPNLKGWGHNLLKGRIIQ